MPPRLHWPRRPRSEYQPWRNPFKSRRRQPGDSAPTDLFGQHLRRAAAGGHLASPLTVGQALVVHNRYRERFGRYYEDFKVGDIYEHRSGRTLSEADNTWFTLLTMNTHTRYFDAGYAKHSEFGRSIVCSPLTIAIMVGQNVTDVSQKAIANLGWTNIRMAHPLFAGDTVTSETN